MKEQPNYYAIIPATVRYDKTLIPNAKLLYGEITALSNKDWYCWAWDSYFMELYWVSRQSIQSWFRSLEYAKYITREVKYKEGSKEILHRYTRIIAYPMQENLHTPMQENLTDNNTSYNNTNNNTINKDDDLFSSTISEFKKMRKSIRKPMTEKAEELLLWELEKLAPWDEQMKIAILNKSILNCWQWVFPLKEEDKKAMIDPLLVEYENQVKVCSESWRANESSLERLGKIMDKILEKYWKDEAIKIRKEIKKRVCW